MRRRASASLGLAGTALAILAIGCAEGPYEVSEGAPGLEPVASVGPNGPVATAVTRNGTGATVGQAWLGRRLASLTGRLRVALPLEGQAVTVWAHVFNQPDDCSSRPCPSSELGLASGVSLQLDGRVVEGSTAWFLGSLPAGPAQPITNPLGADVRFIVRTHGPAIPGRIEEQLGSAGGACDTFVTPDIPDAEGECSDVAFAAFEGGTVPGN